MNFVRLLFLKYPCTLTKFERTFEVHSSYPSKLIEYFTLFVCQGAFRFEYTYPVEIHHLKVHSHAVPLPFSPGSHLHASEYHL